MERLNREKSARINTSGVRTWGMIILVLGLVGSSIIQNQMLGIGQASAQQILEAMQASQNVMALVTVALVLQAIETCAAPIFCFLLVEGFRHTSSFQNYLLRVAGVALISELPYNLALTGSLFDMGSRNPVFGMVLGLILLYFYNRYSQRSFAHVAIKIAVSLAALVWANMLKIDGGACCVVMVAALWMFRKNEGYRNLFACVAAGACIVFSPFYLASPMGVMAIHAYNGEKGAENRLVNYLWYPMVLLLFALVGKFFF